MKKHEKIAKREASGFKYYTKKDQCGKAGEFHYFQQKSIFYAPLLRFSDL